MSELAPHFCFKSSEFVKCRFAWCSIVWTSLPGFCLDFAHADLQPLSLSGSLLFADDNSNQSSIADASPIKQENSSNSSPVPEQNSTGQVDGPGSKSDDTPTDAKEEAGSEGNNGDHCPAESW